MALTREQIEENIKYLKENNASKETIEKYIQEKYTPSKRVQQVKEFEDSPIGIGSATKSLAKALITEGPTKPVELVKAGKEVGMSGLKLLDRVGMRGLLNQEPESSRLEEIEKSRLSRAGDPALSKLISEGKEAVGRGLEGTFRALPTFIGGAGPATLRGMLGRSLATGTAMAGQQAVQGETVGTVASKSGGALALNLAGEAIFAIPNKALRVLGPIVRKKAQKILVEKVSDLPVESVDLAVSKLQSGENIFARPFRENEPKLATNKIADGIKEIRGKASQLKKEEEAYLKSLSFETIDTTPILEAMKEFTQTRTGFGSVQLLSKSEIKSFNALLKSIKPRMTVKEILGLNKKMQKESSFKVGEIIPRKEKELRSLKKNIGGKTRDMLRQASPELATINDSLSEINTISDLLSPKMKSLNSSNFIERAMKSPTQADTKELLRNLDSLLPEQGRFFDDLENYIVRKPFQELYKDAVDPEESAKIFIRFFDIANRATSSGGEFREGATSLARLVAPRASTEIVE